MNNDHPEAVIAYAKHYGGLKTVAQAQMVEITPEAMAISADGQSLTVPFDHKLTDSEDAHRTLVAMLKELPNS